ncbi:MAG: DUF488 domain-containing protein [Thermoprotei archaeon]
MIKIKRIYEEPSEDDGYRILVDRLWPRGLSKKKSKIDLWLRDIAPSNDLRKWFSHDPAKWNEFKKRYIKELENNSSLQKLIEIIKQKNSITLLYATKDKERNNATVIKEYIEFLLNNEQH